MVINVIITINFDCLKKPNIILYTNNFNYMSSKNTDYTWIDGQA